MGNFTCKGYKMTLQMQPQTIITVSGNPEFDRFVPKKVLLEKLGISPSTLQRYIKAGKLPPAGWRPNEDTPRFWLSDYMQNVKR